MVNVGKDKHRGAQRSLEMRPEGVAFRRMASFRVWLCV